MKDFNYWKKLHEAEHLEEFTKDRAGLLWLKTKSIVRKELITEFAQQFNIELKQTGLNNQFIELYAILSSDVEKSHSYLNDYILNKNGIQLQELDRDKLVSELYKLKHFDWGGDYQNALDKYLVSRYVKVLKSYDTLISKFETEINIAVQGYVLNSWYNHWSSILIEHIFKSHGAVLPTVGQIKSVDFFISDIPFDLKVTYLPSEYIKQKRAEKDLPVELTYLKSKAKQAGIYFDKSAKPNEIYYEITEKMRDKGDELCLKVLETLKSEKLDILAEAQANPKLLSKWLYENQGDMRFGSENRLFLVLVDTNDFSNSWKLKRDLTLLEPTIYKYLDEFKYDLNNSDNLLIEYNFPRGSQTEYKSLADIIFVVKE